MNTVYPQPGYGQPAYNPYPPPAPAPVLQAPVATSNNQTIVQAPAPAAPTVIVTGTGAGGDSGAQARFTAGSCTRCGGDIGPGPFTTSGILCAICCFPCGILCCLKWKNKKCKSCGRVYKS